MWYYYLPVVNPDIDHHVIPYLPVVDHYIDYHVVCLPSPLHVYPPVAEPDIDYHVVCLPPRCEPWWYVYLPVATLTLITMWYCYLPVVTLTLITMWYCYLPVATLTLITMWYCYLPAMNLYTDYHVVLLPPRCDPDIDYHVVLLPPRCRPWHWLPCGTVTSPLQTLTLITMYRPTRHMIVDTRNTRAMIGRLDRKFVLWEIPSWFWSMLKCTQHQMWTVQDWLHHIWHVGQEKEGFELMDEFITSGFTQIHIEIGAQYFGNGFLLLRMT